MSSDRPYVPEGWPQVIARLSVHSPEETVRFIKEVFDAEGDFTSNRPTELRIGGSMVMVASILERAPTSSFLYVYVADTDFAYRRAIELGATSIEAPSEMPYGDRRSMVEDPWGNRWQIATHRKFEGDA